MKIKSKLWLMIAVTILGLVALSFFSLQFMQNSLQKEKELQLTKLVDGIFSELNHYQQLVVQGQLTEAQAQEQAKAFIKAYRYGDGDYFWINDKSPRMIMHAAKPKMDNTDLSNFQDKKGKYIYLEFVKAAAISDSGGFVSYYFPKANSDIPLPKLSQVREFKPWGWIVGTGIYVDDIAMQMSELKYWLLAVSISVLVIILLVFLWVYRGLSSAISGVVGDLTGLVSVMQFNRRFARRNDEFNDIAQAMNILLSNLEGAISDANHTVSALAQGDFSQRIHNPYIGDLDALKQGINASAQNIDQVMHSLADVIKALRDGQFDIQVTTQAPGDYGQMLVNASDAVAELHSVFSDLNQVMLKMNEGDFSARVQAEARGDLLAMKTCINASMDRLSQAMDSITQLVVEQSNGDLTRTVDDVQHGQLASLQSAINRSVIKLKDIVTQVMSASSVVGDASQQVSQGSSDLSSRVQQQAAAIEQTSATMHEMASAVAANTQNARKVAELTQQVQSQAQAGLNVMTQTIHAMQSISESSNKIADIVTLIDGIAFQTNLLALNAAVEAARAGEHGRGFAVVASEVRALAGKSADAAKDIKNLIEDSVQRIQGGTALADKSGEMLDGIAVSITQVAGMIDEIATASAQQNEGINQVNLVITDIDRMTQENAALVEETTAAASSLNHEAMQLRSNMSFFNVGHVERGMVRTPKLVQSNTKVNALSSAASAGESADWQSF